MLIIIIGHCLLPQMIREIHMQQYYIIQLLQSFQTFPPMTRPAEKSWNFPIFFNTSKVWYANSLVGEIIRAPNPSMELHFCL